MGKHSLKRRIRRDAGAENAPTVIDGRRGANYEAQLQVSGGNRPCFEVLVFRASDGVFLRAFGFQTAQFRAAKDFMVRVANDHFTL